MSRPRRRYDDKFRASAVVMLEAAGYPNKKGALDQVAKRLGVPHPTLHRWMNEKNNPAPFELVQEKRVELKDLLQAEIEAALGEMPSARIEASYRDLGTVLGILIDKKQLLEGKPTDRLDVNVNSVSDSDITREFTDLLNTARTRAGSEVSPGD